MGLDQLPDAAPAQIIILGEIHDNPQHHLNQAALISRWDPAAIVMEMLTPQQAGLVVDMDRDDVDAMAHALEWAASGWPDFAMYHPVFVAAGPARIYGAALDRDDVRRAMTEGAAAVFGTDAATFGLATPLPSTEQLAREADQKSAHCNAMPDEMLPGMVDAQRLRDASFARTALQALTETGGPVVVIAGAGHADRLRGIPAALAVAAPQVSVFSLGQAESPPGPDAPFHAWVVSAPALREDPCAVFR